MPRNQISGRKFILRYINLGLGLSRFSVCRCKEIFSKESQREMLKIRVEIGKFNRLVFSLTQLKFISKIT